MEKLERNPVLLKTSPYIPKTTKLFLLTHHYLDGYQVGVTLFIINRCRRPRGKNTK